MMKKYTSPILSLLLTAGLLFHSSAHADQAAMPLIPTFAKHCYLPNQAGGRSIEPAMTAATNAGWLPVPEQQRAEYGLPDNQDVNGWVMHNKPSGDLMVLQLSEQLVSEGGVHNGQLRINCRLVLASANNDKHELLEQMRELLGDQEGSTDDDHMANLGYPTPAGWEQACWTVLTRLENRDWKPYRHDDRPVCVWLTSPRNYVMSQYIVIRLLTHAASNVAIIEMDRMLRPDA